MSDSILEVQVIRGLDLAMAGAPEQRVRDGARVETVALQGNDYPHVRPSMEVTVGDAVIRGQTLFTDRKRPAVKFTAPVSGTVLAIDRGHRRSFSSLRINVDGNDAMTFNTLNATPQGNDVRAMLLTSGLWPALRTRPFGDIPDPDATAHCIFVTAMDTNPLAADAAVVIAEHAEHFRHGVRCLSALSNGKVFVCQRGGTPLAGEAMAGVTTAVFDGPHPAGLPSTHIYHLAPASREQPVWHIGYQDVIAIGYLAHTGQLWAQRIVAVGGPAARVPALYRTLPGANLYDLVAAPASHSSATDQQSMLILSGSPLAGRKSTYLCRFHEQVSIMHTHLPKTSRSIWSRLMRTLDSRAAGAIIAHEALEEVLPFDIYPVPLMRALSVGDSEAAQRLGCLHLVEEDVALLSYLCTSGADYGRLLRMALDELQANV